MNDINYNILHIHIIINICINWLMSHAKIKIPMTQIDGKVMTHESRPIGLERLHYTLHTHTHPHTTHYLWIHQRINHSVSDDLSVDLGALL